MKQADSDWGNKMYYFMLVSDNRNFEMVLSISKVLVEYIEKVHKIWGRYVSYFVVAGRLKRENRGEYSQC